jgi:hypothetical protein
MINGPLSQADGYAPGPGVVLAPPELISDAIKMAVANVLAAIPSDKHAAIVGIATRSGVNLAVAYRLDDRFEVAAWVGKAGWDHPLGAGVQLQAVF